MSRAPAPLDGGLMAQAQLDRELRRLFAPQARSEGPLAASSVGRLRGIEPRQRLGPEQVGPVAISDGN